METETGRREESGFKTAVRRTAMKARATVAAVTVFAAMMLAPTCIHAQANPADLTAFYRYSKGQFYKVAVDTDKMPFVTATVPATQRVSGMATLYSDYHAPANKLFEGAVAAKAGPVDPAIVVDRWFGPKHDETTDLWGSADVKGPAGSAACALVHLNDARDAKFGARMVQGPLTGFINGSLTRGKLETPNGRLNLNYGLRADTPVATVNVAWFNASEALNIRVSRLLRTGVGSFIPELGVEMSERAIPSYRVAVAFIPK